MKKKNSNFNQNLKEEKDSSLTGGFFGFMKNIVKDVGGLIGDSDSKDNSQRAIPNNNSNQYREEPPQVFAKNRYSN